MMGPLNTEIRGVIPRTMECIFESIMSKDEGTEYTIQVSYVEIYCERLADLLNPRNQNPRIRERKGRGIFVEGCEQCYVKDSSEVYKLMNIGTANKHMAETKMNATSSRSHCVFLMNLAQKELTTETRKTSKLIMVDLAGSEKVKRTEASGQTLAEAQQINLSLTNLGMVINALTEKQKHIPFRNSKLTRLLSDSLGGNSRTRMICNASPSSTN